MPHVEPTPDQYDRLHRFLASAFSPEALQSLLLRLDGGRAVAYELPAAHDAPLHFFHRAAERLWQHGLVRAPLFELLIQHRPHRRREIVEVAGVFGVPLDEPTQAPAGASASFDLPDAAIPGPMLPTFGGWCRLHARAQLALVSVSVLAAGLAYRLSPPSVLPDDGPDATRLAVKVGQVVLSGAALLCFALARTPGASTLFGPSSTYAQMWKRLGALEDATSPRVSTLRAAAGADPQTREAVTHWLDAAIEAREQMRRSWLWLCFSWMSLYGVAVALELGAPDFSPHTFAVMKVLLTTLNNAAAASLFVGFWVLSFITVPIPEAPRRDARRPTAAGVGILAAAVVAFYGFVQLTLCLQELRLSPGLAADTLRAKVQAVANPFDVGSGLASAIVMSMFIGRLDSKFIDASWPVLMLLYLYAAVQPSWSFLELIRRGETSAQAVSLATSANSAEELVFLFAWAAKTVLFALFAWVFHTGRLDFYFLRVRRLQDRVAADWRALSG